MAPMDHLERSARKDPVLPLDRVIAPGPGGRYRGEYEVRVVDFGREVSRSQMRQQLTEDAEYASGVAATRIISGRR